MRTSFESQATHLNLRLRGFIRNTGMPLSEFSRICELTPETVLKWWSGKDYKFKFSHLKKLSNFFLVDSDEIVQDTYDIELIRKRIFYGPLALPEKYQENAFSYTRSSAHIISLIKMMYGQYESDLILRQLRVHPGLFDNHNNRISLIFFTDLLELILKSKPSIPLKLLADSLFVGLDNTETGIEFQNAKNYEHSYWILKKWTNRFDENFDYDFSIRNDGLKLTCKYSEKYLDSHNGVIPRSQSLFQYRLFMFGAFPTLSDLPTLPVQTITCISAGDSQCTYKISFPTRLLAVAAP